MTKKIATLISGMVLLLSAGCCETTYNCGAKPDPYGRDAYTLRGGISTNTRSVRLVSSSPGCPPAPCLPMSANIRCAPPPRAKRAVDCPPPPPLPARPAPAQRPAAPADCVVTGGCPPSSFTNEICTPSGFLGECYTDTTNRPQVDIFVPNGGVLEKLTEALPVAADTVDAPARDVEPAVEKIEAAAPIATGKVEKAESAEKVPEPIAESPLIAEPVTPRNGGEGQAATRDGAAAWEKVAPLEGAGEDAELSLPVLTLPPPISDEPLSANDEMPPMFREGATDSAAEEILSSAASRVAENSGLSRVELPPELE